MLRQHSIFGLLLFSTSALAAEFVRVCQIPVAPFGATVSACAGFEAYVKQNYPQGIIRQDDAHAGCQIIYSPGGCKVDICGFPGTGINSTAFIAAARDIMDNCHYGGSGKYTAGYNIIKGTNATVGVIGDYTPDNVRCAWETNDDGPLVSDCDAAYQQLASQKLVTQDVASGCKVIASSGQCTFSWCDAKGVVTSGADLGQTYVSLKKSCPPQNGRIGGWSQYSPGSRVVIHRNMASLPVISATPVCQPYPEVQGPRAASLPSTITALKQKYPNSIQQNVKDGGCVMAIQQNDVQVDICGGYGSSVLTSQVIDALNQISNACTTSGGANGGSVRIPGSSFTVVISSATLSKNIWCNTASNNSPTVGDFNPILASINTSAVYSRGSSPYDGCTTLFTNGKAKVNFCAPSGNAISGQRLYDALNDLNTKCKSNNYVSGIYQIYNDVSIGIYDPPGGYAVSGVSDYQTAVGTDGRNTECIQSCKASITYNGGDMLPGCGNNFVEADFIGTCDSLPPAGDGKSDPSITVSLTGCQGDNNGLQARWYYTSVSDPGNPRSIISILDYGSNGAHDNDMYTAYNTFVTSCQSVSKAGCGSTGGGCSVSQT